MAWMPVANNVTGEVWVHYIAYENTSQQMRVLCRIFAATHWLYYKTVHCETNWSLPSRARKLHFRIYKAIFCNVSKAFLVWIRKKYMYGEWCKEAGNQCCKLFTRCKGLVQWVGAFRYANTGNRDQKAKSTGNVHINLQFESKLEFLLNSDGIHCS